MSCESRDDHDSVDTRTSPSIQDLDVHLVVRLRGPTVVYHAVFCFFYSRKR